MPLYVKVRYDPVRQGRYIETQPTMGSRLLDFLTEARGLAERLECGVEFEFNGHLVWMTPDDDPATQMVWFEQLWERLEALLGDNTGDAQMPRVEEGGALP